MSDEQPTSKEMLEDGPSVIGTDLAPMPTAEDYRRAHKAEYVRLFVAVGVPENVAADWHDDEWDDRLKDSTPQQCFDDEVAHWEQE